MHNVGKTFLSVIDVSLDSQGVEKHQEMWRGGGRSGVLRGPIKVTDAPAGPKAVG